MLLNYMPARRFEKREAFYEKSNKLHYHKKTTKNLRVY